MFFYLYLKKKSKKDPNFSLKRLRVNEDQKKEESKIMSAEVNKEEPKNILLEVQGDNLSKILSEIIIPFSEVIEHNNVPDIYQGYEKIPFHKRHPIYKTLMKLEFEESIREYKNK